MIPQAMVHMLIYLFALLIACGYAAARGGKPERIGAAIMLIGSLLTAPAGAINPQWLDTQYAIFAIDVAVLAAFLALALLSDRFWPLWVTGFHLVAVMIHLLTLTKAPFLPYAYALAQGFWAYPMLLALAIGAGSHWKEKSRAMARSNWLR